MTKPNLRDPEQWIPRDVFAAYCGAGSDKLLAYYDKAKAKQRMITPDFDWLAFLLLPAWFGYRRQWNLWGTLTGLLLAASVVEALLQVQIPSGAFAGTSLGLGLMAHGILLSNANAQFLKLKKQGLTHDAIRTALANRALPSAGLACAALMGSLALSVAAALLMG